MEPMEPKHDDQVVTLFSRLEEATGGSYPPRALLDHYYPPGAEGIAGWLAKGKRNHHFVFVLDESDTVVGHIEVQTIDDDLTEEEQAYWLEAFASQAKFNDQMIDNRPVHLRDLAVIKRLGVHPEWQGRDVGRQLLRRSIHFIEHDLTRVPALVVLNELKNAQALYDSEGAQRIGEFTEATGEPMVSYVF